MFIRRLYYNSQGEILHSYMMSGDLKPLSASEEATRLGLEDWSVMEWNKFDDEIEANFLASYGRASVDLSGDEPTLVFDFSTPEVEEESIYDTCSLSLSSDGVVGIAEIVSVVVENNKVVNYQNSEVSLPLTIDNLLCGSLIYFTLKDGMIYQYQTSENGSVAHDIYHSQASYYVPAEKGSNGQIYFYEYK